MTTATKARRNGAAEFRIPSRLLARYESGELTIPQLSRGLHADNIRVVNELHRLGVDASRSRRKLLMFARRGIDHKRTVELHKGGLTLQEVGERVGLTREGVRRVLIRAGVPTRRRGQRPIVFNGESLDPEAFVRRLHRLRTDAGLSRREVASRTGLEVSTIWKLENGKQRPRRETVAKLAEGLGVTVLDLAAPLCAECTARGRPAKATMEKKPVNRKRRK